MTRFARAKGSKASNEKIPEDATPWAVMKEGMLTKNSGVDVTPTNTLIESFIDGSNCNEKVPAEWASMEDEDAFDLGLLRKRRQQLAEEKLHKTTNNVAGPVEQEKKKKKKKKKQLLNDDSVSNSGESMKTTNNVAEPMEQEKKKKKKKKKQLLNDDSVSNSGESMKTANNVEKMKSFKENGKLVKMETKNVAGKIKPVKGKEMKKKMETENVSKKIHPVEDSRKEKETKRKNEVRADAEEKVEVPKKKRKESKGMIESKKTISSNKVESTCKSVNNGKKINFGQKKEMQGEFSNKDMPLNDKKGNQTPLKYKVDEFGRRIDEGKRIKKKKKIDEDQFDVYINGETITVVKFDGYYVRSEDAKRLEKLRFDLHAKKIPPIEISKVIKLERRKAERNLSRLKKTICFNCRKGGHNLSECQEVIDNHDTAMGVCYKCGSTEHNAFQCRVGKGDVFRFAECFICKEQGHIARQCPDNPKGLYPKGGACKVCGEVTHLRKDCPQALTMKTENAVTLSKRNDRLLETLEEEDSHVNKPCTLPRVKKAQHVRF